MIRGIPTVYQHVRFRSRLEAKWAAMFDALGWRWEYEPFDLAGWIPDFLLPDANMLVEVKPVDRFPMEVAAKIERGLTTHIAESNDGLRVYLDREAMILGHSCPIDSCGFDCRDGRAIGWLLANPMTWHPEQRPTWGRAIVQAFQECRILAELDRKMHWYDRLDSFPERERDEMLAYVLSDQTDRNELRQSFGLYCENDTAMRSDPDYVHADKGDVSFCAGNRFRHRGHNDIVFWDVYSLKFECRSDPGKITGENCKLTELWRESSNKVQWMAKRQ